MKIEKLKSGSYRIRKMYKGLVYSVVVDYKPTQKEALILLAHELKKLNRRKCISLLKRQRIGTLR